MRITSIALHRIGGGSGDIVSVSDPARDHSPQSVGRGVVSDPARDHSPQLVGRGVVSDPTRIVSDLTRITPPLPRGVEVGARELTPSADGGEVLVCDCYERIRFGVVGKNLFRGRKFIFKKFSN